MSTPIHHTFGPHVTLRYALRSLTLLLMPWCWRNTASCRKLQAALHENFHSDTFLFGSGREGLLAFFQAINLRAGEEVIVQAYTCAVVPNAIHAAGGIPVFVDIERDTLNLDLEAVKSAISPRTRVIICQHTFGIPSDTDGLRQICDTHNILLLEDSAHIIPDEMGPKTVTTKGDAILLSFGRDKAVSGISGGALIVRRPEISQVLQRRDSSLLPHSYFTIGRLLLYPLLYLFARPFYNRTGKYLLYAAKKMHLLLPIVTTDEKNGRQSALLHRMPNVCAVLVLRELRRLRTINNHRRFLTAFYLETLKKLNAPIQIPSAITPDLPMQKFPIFLKNAQEIRKKLLKDDIYLDDGWTGCVICPPSVSLEALHYEWGRDPQSEAMCEQILSLPTHPTMTLTQAKRLINILSQRL